MVKVTILAACAVICGCAPNTRLVNVPVPVLPAVPEELLAVYPGEIPTATTDGVVCFTTDETKSLQAVINWYKTRHEGLAELWNDPGSVIDN